MRVVVVGAGMVGNRFADELTRMAPGTEVEVLGAEPHTPYNRVMLTELVAGRADLAGLSLPTPDAQRVRVRTGVEVGEIDPRRRTVTSTAGTHPYDVLVLATGARARVVPVPGLRDGLPRGAHVLRRLDDARDITAAALNARHAVVVGGGPLGLETACALRHRGVGVTVVSAGPVLSRDVDSDAADVVAHQVGALGIQLADTARLTSVAVRDGRVTAVHLDDGRALPADLLVLAAGSVPDTTLAADAGLATDVGIVVDDRLRTSDPAIRAIGDCAETPAGVSGLVAPGWDQARALARTLAQEAGSALPPVAGSALPPVAGSALRLKAVGMSVVTAGVRASTAHPDDRVLSMRDPRERRHVEVVTRGDSLVGFTCVGSPDLASHLATQIDRPGMLPADPMHLLLGAAGAGRAEAPSPTTMPASTTVCRCNGVTKGDVVHAWDAGATSVETVAETTLATTGCGGCTQLVEGLVCWLRESDPPTGAAANGTLRSPA